MFIKNSNLRNKLGMGRLLEADKGGSGGTDTGTEEIEETETEEEEEPGKTFTQEEFNAKIKERVAREKKNQLSKEYLQFKIRIDGLSKMLHGEYEGIVAA